MKLYLCYLSKCIFMIFILNLFICPCQVQVMSLVHPSHFTLSKNFFEARCSYQLMEAFYFLSNSSAVIHKYMKCVLKFAYRFSRFHEFANSRIVPRNLLSGIGHTMISFNSSSYLSHPEILIRKPIWRGQKTSGSIRNFDP